MWMEVLGVESVGEGAGPRWGIGASGSGCALRPGHDDTSFSLEPFGLGSAFDPRPRGADIPLRPGQAGRRGEQRARGYLCLLYTSRCV